MGSATRVPNIPAMSGTTGSHGVSRVWDRSITPSAPSQASSGLGARLALAPNLLCFCHFRPLRWGGARAQQAALRGAPTQRSAALLAVRNLRFAAPNVTGSVVLFAAAHQLPAIARGFVGHHDRNELGMLALGQ